MTSSERLRAALQTSMARAVKYPYDDNGIYLSNASSTLSAAGNSFEQSVALLTDWCSTNVMSYEEQAMRAVVHYASELLSPHNSEAFRVLLEFDGDPIRNTSPEYIKLRRILFCIAEKWEDISPQQQIALAEEIAGRRCAVSFLHIISSLIELRHIARDHRNNRLRDLFKGKQNKEEVLEATQEVSDFLSGFKVIEKGVETK